MLKTDQELTLQITRKIAAPIEQVYAAWTVQTQLEQWMCRDQKTYRNQCLALDLRPSGRFVIDIHTPEDDAYVQHGTFLEIVPLEQLVFTWFYEKTQARGIPTDFCSPKTLVTVTFRPLDDATEITLVHEQFTTRQEYEGTLAGWNGCFDALEQFLGAKTSGS